MRAPFLVTALLLAAPALAEGQYELAKPSAQCEVAGMRAADQRWEENSSEAKKIAETAGRILRERSQLTLRLTSGRPITLSDVLASEADGCGVSGDVLHQFHSLVDGYALLDILYWEGRGLLLVDLKSGTKSYLSGGMPLITPNKKHLILGAPYYTGHPTITLVRLSHPLKTATIGGWLFHRDSAAWRNSRILDLAAMKSLGEETDDFVLESVSDGTLAINPNGIEVRIEKTGEILTAPFEPVSPQ